MKDRFPKRQLPWIMWGLVVSGSLITLVVICLYLSTFGSTRSEEHEAWSQFGDYIGGVLGPVFALLALIALLITLHLQSRELAVSSQELGNSAKALAQQSSSLRLQNFESHFFNMLTLHHTIVNGMDLRSKGNVTAQGRDCLRVFYHRFKNTLAAPAQGTHPSYRARVAAEYLEFYRENGHEISHYFRNLYRILKFVEKSDFVDRKEYSGILRAQLSNPELGLLFYNGLSHHGKKLKPLAETYALFENMELKLLSSPAKDILFYDMKAFGDQV